MYRNLYHRRMRSTADPAAEKRYLTEKKHQETNYLTGAGTKEFPTPRPRTGCPRSPLPIGRGIENSREGSERPDPRGRLGFPTPRRGGRVGFGTHPPRRAVENPCTAPPTQKSKARRLAPPGQGLPLRLVPSIVQFSENPGQGVERKQEETQQGRGEHGQGPGDLLPQLPPRHDRISLTRRCTAS